MTEVRRLNRAGSPCEEAEGYSLVRCVEDFVAADAGCKSPWDRFEDAGGGRKVGKRETGSQLLATSVNQSSRSTPVKIIKMGGSKSTGAAKLSNNQEQTLFKDLWRI